MSLSFVCKKTVMARADFTRYVDDLVGGRMKRVLWTNQSFPNTDEIHGWSSRTLKSYRGDTTFLRAGSAATLVDSRRSNQHHH